jgi:hypothetical protein
MAGGLAVAVVGGRSAEYHAELSWRVFLVCIVASSGGLLFGYDLGANSITAWLDRCLILSLSSNGFFQMIGFNCRMLLVPGIAGGVASMQGFLEVRRTVSAHLG